MTDDQTRAPAPSKWLDYLRLVRAPNVFTAVADVSMGYLFVHNSLQPTGVFVCLVAASSLLYMSGMVLNDVYDVEVDRRERPQRPLPSGRIPVGWAMQLGYAMLLAGVACAWLAGYLVREPEVLAWRGGVTAVVLAICIVLYDAVLKATPLGPLLMGSCRLLNVLLGMSIAVPFTGAGGLAGFGPHQLLVAGGIGGYIVGVTWFARGEAGESKRGRLGQAVAVILAGLVMLALFPRYVPAGFTLTLRSDFHWLMLLGLLAMTIVRRCLMAISNPSPQQVQAAVKHGILSLIVLDAAVTLQACQPLVWSLWVLALLAPTIVLGQWVYST